MNPETQDAKIKRLNRIAGQVEGIKKMIESDRYCIDILNQMQAVKAAFSKLESEILKDHAACCVSEAIASGDQDAQREKMTELINLFDKLKR